MPVLAEHRRLVETITIRLTMLIRGRKDRIITFAPRTDHVFPAIHGEQTRKQGQAATIRDFIKDGKIRDLIAVSKIHNASIIANRRRPVHFPTSDASRSPAKIPQTGMGGGTEYLAHRRPSGRLTFGRKPTIPHRWLF